ncbi:MAG: acetyl-CoA carboxylase biotin carboxyl carrier protein [Candidatus Zixiibacteriota bacterium]|nr:MAG: acetyl-CoA carboxylase biotin carboxyl carrier protein [candidate division Zixibacteria bacterium]
MRPSKIRSLIKLVEESNINELEVSSWGRKVCIRKRIGGGNGQGSANPGANPAPPGQSEVQLELTTESPKEPEKKVNLVEIKSPMVGTFYRAPAPDARPYADVGENVKTGQVVCIIEAMKLMNEIEAEIAGKIVEVLVENGKPVQFGQSLFLVEPH